MGCQSYVSEAGFGQGLWGTIKYLESKIDMDLKSIVKSFAMKPSDEIFKLLQEARASDSTNNSNSNTTKNSSTKTKSGFSFTKHGDGIKYNGNIDLNDIYAREFFLESILPKETDTQNDNHTKSNSNNSNTIDSSTIALANLFDLANTCLHTTMSDQAFGELKQCFDRCLSRAGIPSDTVISKQSHSRHKLTQLKTILSDASEMDKDEWLRNHARCLDFLIDINTTGKVPSMNIFIQLSKCTIIFF